MALPVFFLLGLFSAISSTSAQIVPVKLGGLQGLCPVSDQSVRVLPGNFSRDVQQPFTSTQTNGENDLNQLGNCQFISFDPSFDLLLGSNQTFYQLGGNATTNYAHEGPVYLPESEQVYFASQGTGQLSLVSLDTGLVTPVPLQESIGAANGATNYMGQVALTTFGADVDEGLPPGIILLDPYNGTWNYIINNWFGLRFDGPNDIVALDDGSLIFTDSGYAVQQGISPSPNQVGLVVYILPPKGPARVLVDGLPGVPTYGTPNGVLLSPDQQTLYVTTTVTSINNIPTEQFAYAHSIYAYDLQDANGGISAVNGRIFCTVDVGIPDGLKADVAGNIFTSAGDGIQVFNPAGILIGKIIIPAALAGKEVQGISNLVFAGDRLVILHNSNILMLPLNTTGALTGMA